MSGTTSISGLSSGLDSASIIDQLMTLESASQTKLKSSLTTQQQTLKSLQDLNTRISALASQAADLRSADTWNALEATSSSTAVSVTAGSGAVVGSYDLAVVSCATSTQHTFSTTVAPGDRFSATTTSFTLTLDGAPPRTIDTGTGTMSALVTALNASGTQVRASTVTLDDGTQRLVVTSTATGSASDFTLTAGDATPLLGGATVTSGTDAEVRIGTDTVTSSTNTFSKVLTGVSFTVSPAAPGTTVHVEVASDPTALVSKVKALVASVNGSLSAIDSLTAYNPDTRTSGPLAGDTAARSLRTSLLETVYPADGTSLASVGLQTDRTGKLVFDAEAFTTAYAADPAGVAATFSSAGVAGFASRVNAVAIAASDSYNGTLTSAITGRSTSLKQTQDDIADWDIRLALKQTSLQRQFTALETALNQMNSQSAWLAGQISSLTTSS